MDFDLNLSSPEDATRCLRRWVAPRYSCASVAVGAGMGEWLSLTA